MGQIIDPNSLLIKTDQQPATVTFFNNLITQFCNAINGVGVRMDGYDQTEEQLIELGLANINSVLGPFLGTLQEAAQLGFLVAQADGHSLSLSVGAPFDLILTSDGAELFTPTRWLMALDVTDYTNWGILQLDSWVVQDLNLASHCIYASKTQASTSWQVACGSGVLNAMVDDLNAATAAASNAQASATSAAANAATISAALGAISAAGVTSINGKSGIIPSLAEGDIANLVSDLAARATTTYVNTQLSGKQPSSATLTSLAALTLSTFIISFLGATNAATALTSLGAAPLASPTFTGTPKAPTPTAGDNSTNIATTQFTAAAITAIPPPVIPTKASSATVLAGTDDTQFATSLGIANNYSLKSAVFNVQSGTTYTLTAADSGKIIALTSNSASGVTVTLPNSLPVGFSCMIEQRGTAASVQINPASGASLHMSNGRAGLLNSQYSVVSLWVWSNSGTNAVYNMAGDYS